MDLAQAYSLFKQGKLSQAKVILDTLLSEKLLKDSEYEAATMLEARVLLKQGEYEESLRILESLEQQLEGRKPNLVHAELLILIAEAMWRLRNYDAAMTKLRQAKNVLGTLEQDESVMLSMGRLRFREATIKYSLNQLDSSLQELLECKSIFEAMNDIPGLAGVLNNIALIYERKGDLAKAKEYYEQSLQAKELVGDKEDIARTLHNMGRVEISQGNLAKALSLLERSASLKEDIGNKRGLALTLGEIGVVYLMRGELDSAEASFQRVQAIREEFRDFHGLISSTLNLGLIAHSKNQVDKARKYYLDALSLAKDAKDLSRISRIYHNLIILELEQGNPAIAKRYMEEFEALTRESTSPELYYDYLLSKAIVLKSSKRVLDKGEAQKILLNIANEEVTNISRTITAIIHLCELLFSDYEAFGDQTVLIELKNWINKLRDYSSQQESIDLKAKVLLIEAKLSLLESKPREALVILSKAQTLADENGLLNLAFHASTLYDEAIALIGERTTPQASNSNLSMVSLLRTASGSHRIPFGEIENETPIAIVIVANTGEIVFRKQFSEEFAIDENLIRSLLTIVNHFSSSSIDEQRIERISLGGLTLLVKRVLNVFLVYIIKGSSFSAMQKFEALIQAISARSKLWESIRNTQLKSNPILISQLNQMLATSFNISIEDIDEEVLESEVDIPAEMEFPAELMQHKRLLHPVKLAILNLLSKHYRLATSEVRKILGIPWGNLETHLNALRKADFIEQKVEFVDDRARQILYLTGHGSQVYSVLSQALQRILTRA